MITDNVDKIIIEVCLRVWGDLLQPECVTKELNVEPTRSHLKGAEKKSSKGGERITKSGYWELDTKKIVDSNLLTDHLSYLIQVLKRSNQNVKLLAGCQGVEISLILGATDDNSLEFIFNTEMLKQVVELGIELHFVIL